MKNYHPLRLRDNWHSAYTGFEPVSEMPPNLSEEMAREFIISALLFAQKINRIVSKSEFKSNILEDRQTFSEFFHLAGGITNGGITSYIAGYIKENSEYTKRQLRQDFNFNTNLKNIHSDPDDWLKLVSVIDQSKNLSYLGFLSSWIDIVKPQYTQTLMLHIGDAIDNAIARHSANDDVIKDDLLLLKNAYEKTGLNAAISNIRSLVPNC